MNTVGEDLEFESLEDQPAEPAPSIATVQQRLETWRRVAIAGSDNLIDVAGVLYCWDVRPRIQKNGSAIGRIHMQRRGEVFRDAGAYKIDAGGRVLQIPAELAGVLPGAEDAGSGEAVP